MVHLGASLGASLSATSEDPKMTITSRKLCPERVPFRVQKRYKEMFLRIFLGGQLLLLLLDFRVRAIDYKRSNSVYEIFLTKKWQNNAGTKNL